MDVYFIYTFSFRVAGINGTFDISCFSGSVCLEGAEEARWRVSLEAHPSWVPLSQAASFVNRGR